MTDLVKKRSGSLVPFDKTRIYKAIKSAFCSAKWGIKKDSPLNVNQETLVREVFDKALDRIKESPQLDVEEIQDRVEEALMELKHFEVAKDYILYRKEREKVRELHNTPSHLKSLFLEAAQGLPYTYDLDSLVESAGKQLFTGISEEETIELAILTVRSYVELDPDYDALAARLLLKIIHGQAEDFGTNLLKGIEARRIDPELKKFDLKKLGKALDPKRDDLFGYFGLKTLYDRYLLHIEGRRIETPQTFWMRVAMGISLNEKNREEKAIEFYHILSTFRYIPGTPTLYNSGTLRPQLSSCYLLTVEDDLESIFKMISDDAKLSKWAGGLGNDWTAVRATNANIQGTNGTSQGVIPFLKIANDTALAVNQGGKRKGAMCAYLEVWHLDLEDFLDLRKNTGDERRRTHDMNTANWIPDLFMKRVEEEKSWTLFDPSEAPDLHDLYGKAFEEKYQAYEAFAEEGKIKLFKRLDAKTLWRKMLSRLFETGHPWITWKDPANVRSAQRHQGVIHSSNLCTEIFLNTSKEETAVCNLGSVNLNEHLVNGALDKKKLEETIHSAVRMLDNVIDINYYPTPEAKEANKRHRPVGLGLMGFQDALFQLNIPYASKEALEFADSSMELISYFAIRASSLLAEERGCYETYQGSLWSKGLLPIDTLVLLEEERGVPLDLDKSVRLDWSPLRKLVEKHGMRNAQVMAIAPTATISQIVGVTQSIEPLYSVLHVKSNLSGNFTYVNRFLINKLKSLGIWDREMLDELKYEDGSIQDIEKIPQEIRAIYKTCFEVGAEALIQAAALRQKWIDMGQSLNLYLSDPSGRKLDEMYKMAWRMGLKSTYYLRTRAATQVEKSTLDVNRFGIQPKWMKNKSASGDIQVCRLGDKECEACQ